MAYKILIVDDEPANLRLLERLFRRDYAVLTAASGQEALGLLAQHDVALLITDQRMPGMTGIELLKQAASFRPHMVRMILTGYTDVADLVAAINCGHVYRYVTKPWDNDDLRLTVGRAVEHYETNRSRYELERTNERLQLRLQEMTRSFVRTIADALEARDEHVYGHARRVAGYATATGRKLRLEVPKLEQISLAALLHDIGKIGTPDQILLKPADLDEGERAQLRMHSERGARMLSGVPDMEEVADAVRYHHEHWDGSGYPEGLAGEQIPLASRIILVADAYDALTSPRPWRRASDHDRALELIEADAGRQFDPEVVRAFCELEQLAVIRRQIARGFFGARLSAFSFRFASCDFEDLVREVESEPALAAAVLREANAGGAPPVADLRAACERLGEARVGHAVAQLSTRDSCEHDPELLWEHSLRCAEAARLLGERTGAVEPGAAYALGLLHDAGEVLLRSLFPGEMENLLWLDSDARVERETAAFGGVDHAQVGQWVLEACRFPGHLSAAVQAHHDAMRTNTPVALLLHVADHIAHAKDPSEVAALDRLGSDRLAMLGLSRSDLARIHERTLAAVNERYGTTV